MQKGRVLSLKQFGILEFFQKNAFLLTILLFLCLGIILGVFLFDDFSALTEYSKKYITDYTALRTNSSFGKIFIHSFFNSFSILFLFFILGASLFGVVTVPLAMTAKGFLHGAVTAYLYSQYALKGVAFNAVIFIPSVLVFIVVLLLASRESIRFSLKVSSLTMPKTLPLNLSFDFKNYTVKYLLFSIATIFSAVIDTLLSISLIKFFNL